MRSRLSITLVIVICSLVAVIPSTVDARSTPKCQGKTATQFLSSPGTLNSTEGNDVLVGSSGNDVFVVGAVGGVDLVCGGGGDDLIYVNTSGSIADGGSGNDELWTSFGARGYGGSGNDAMHAAFGGYVNGGAGDDTLYIADESTGDGGSGDDHLLGDHATSLLGGSGRDYLEDINATGNMDCGSNADTYSTTGDPTTKRCETQVYVICGCLIAPNLNDLAARLDRFA